MMKNYIFLLFAGLTFSAAQSQEIADALRYSQDNLSGTARFRAMSGAFGALGGDLSSINVNPAGSAIFANNQLTISLSSFNKKNDSNYFGTTTSASDNSFDMNQTGGVFVFKNHNPSSNWKKFSMAIDYEITNNFDNSVFSAGTNPTNSIDKYFLSYANVNPQQNQPGIPLGTIQNYYYEELNFADQQAFLGYEGYIINAIPLASDPSNNENPNIASYSTNIPTGGNYYQENVITSVGYNGKLSFNAATSYKDKFYFGINLNSYFTDYTQSTNFYEDNNNSQTNGLRNLSFRNEQYTYGSGFSFQIGAIAKITNEIRFGLAYESPTWYNLNDVMRQNLSTRGFNYGNPPISGLSNKSTDSDLEITYDPYKLQTPSKINGSFAYIFGKNALISVDYGVKNYSSTKYTEQPDFRSYNINSKLKNELKTTNELRIGAEYKIKEWSLRGGYRFEESPYKDASTIGNLNSFSGGLGYNFGMFKLDFAYTNAQRNSHQGFFNQGFIDGAKINTTDNNFSMTLLFEM